MSPRRLLTLTIAPLLVLAACGNDADESADATAPSATTPSATAAPPTAVTTAPASTGIEAPPVTTPTTAAVNAAPTSTPIAAPTTDVAATSPTGPHTVTNAMGATDVPGEVSRVVVLDSSFLDAAIALGLPPVGATEGTPGSGLPAYLGEALDEIEIAGDTTNPNLEAVAALQPDLILGAKVRHEAIYGQLSEIAPTVFSESSGQDWTAQVLLTAEALGRTPQAEQLLAEFSARATEVGTAIGAEGQTARIVRFIPGQTRVYGPTTFSGSVLSAVGFDLTGTDTGLAYDPAFGMALVSAEQFALLDSDVIFATDFTDEGSARGDFDAVWGALPAVAGGKLFTIEDSTWMTGIGVIGANLILDDLESWLG